MSRVEVARSEDVKENKAVAVKAGDVPLLLTRVGGKACAVSSKCPHLGLPLGKGKIENGSITCPFHGSRFDMCTGDNLDWCAAVVGIPVPGWTSRLLALGKKPQSLPVYETTEENGKVFVRLPG
ncbi:MAG TPA: Rieske 2Fe-2S domain-containing protein [Moraxellaceae bacterium]|nr:Rieske 2Fe-2S domain-containing protein [Moraxellaceae bacterium]